ncbi:hypothetical protein B0H13DRAFT_2054105 [Mycena leptocephala]|nr:hypothetical protein B0H13DRAFT_2054105 [Mycena leptocephala]
MAMDSDARSPTLPQEVIDLILDLTDKKTLKVCSRVARSFRHTSQKRIFSHITLRPPSQFWIKSRHLTLQGFSDILSNSPHLALNVHRLCSISIESDAWLDWDSFPNTLIAALYTTVALPSLTYLRLRYLRFDRGSELASLLRRCRNVDSLLLSRVSVRSVDSSDADAGMLDKRLGLSSLTLDPSLLPLQHSVTSAVDVRSLRYLHTSVSEPEMEAEIQHLLDATENLEHYHVHLCHHSTDTAIIDLQNLSHLRTLEISFPLEFATSPDEYNPIDWAGTILATSPDPSPIQHVILSINIDEKDLPYLFRLEDLEPVLLAPSMAALRKVTVNVDSYDLDFGIYYCERDICEAFSVLCDREILKVEMLGVT